VKANNKKKNSECLLVASKYIDVEVNAEKINYTLIFCQQNAEQNHDIRRENKFFKYVAMFRRLRMALTKQTTFIDQVGLDYIQGLPATIQFSKHIYLPMFYLET